MAEIDNESDMGMGILTQADLDALVAAATEGSSADEAEYGLLEETPELSATPPPAPAPAIGMVDLPSFEAPAAETYDAPEGATGLGRVRDIPLEVTVELGRTRLLIRDILDLSPGSIIELDKIAGEPVDLFANGMLVARGEVIVIDDNFGVRVTEIITAVERKTEKDAHARAA